MQAGVAYGAHIEYECVNPCTTRVFLRMYSDCTISCYWGPGWVRWKPSSQLLCPTQPTVLGGFSPQVVTEYSPVCPGQPTNCNAPGAPSIGLDEYVWYREYDICSASPCNYQLVWQQCCRDYSVNSLINPQSQSLCMNATSITTGLASCDNSPKFIIEPRVRLCAGQDHAISFGAYDVDGDSLSYQLASCYYDSVTPSSYAVGYSPAQPFGSSWNVSLDPRTGILSMDAQPGNALTTIVCVTVNEYRNGTWIGSVQRDIQILVFNCGANVTPTMQSLTNVTGATGIVGDAVYRCSPGPICMDIPTADPNSSQNLTLVWDGRLPGATFSDANTLISNDSIFGTGANPPIGRLCWTPPGNGIYRTRCYVFDDNCPYIGIQERCITFYIGPYAGGSTATATMLPCIFSGFTATFNASGCGPGPFSYTWSGAGGLSGTSQSFGYTYAAPGNYPWQCIITDGNTVHDTIQDTVTVIGQPAWLSLITGNVGLDTCAGSLMNTLLAGAYNSYAWNTGSTSPLLNVTSPGFYSVTVTDGNGCLFQDTATVALQPVDIKGIARTSLGTYLVGQKIYLIQHDTAQQALWAIDSVITDAFGYYQFCNVTDTIVFIKAAPDSLAYPLEMPTYAMLSLFWNSATPYYPLTQLPLTVNFSTLSGANPGGPGFIGGLISQGANKTGAIGDPVVGLRVFLRDKTFGTVLGFRETNANGYFSFSNLPLGDYEIIPDRPTVSITNVPQLTLDNQHPSYDSLDFQMHRYWLELVMGGSTAVSPALPMDFSIAPNPFQGGTRIQLDLPDAAPVEVAISDVMGRRIGTISTGWIKAGHHEWQCGEGLDAGVYFIGLRINGGHWVQKMVKMD
ncbi:MAG: T9SS type A sorting domain-containing protein [Bacteroidia bacterium]